MMIEFTPRGVHFFNRLSIYRYNYLTTIETEYWRGHQRKRIAKLGRFTVWIRQ